MNPESMFLLLTLMHAANTNTLELTKDTAQNVTNESANISSARSLGRSLTQCFRSAEIMNCLENEVMLVLDSATADNATWYYSDFLQVEKLNNTNNNNNSIAKYLTLLQQRQQQQQQQQQRQKRSFGDCVGEKLLELFQTRVLRIQLPEKLQLPGISDTIDEYPTDAIAIEEGRKKKYKEKHMAMMGGMAIMAMFAQMYLGKVLLLAGAAFIMAKIALVISLLGSLKKGSSGVVGSTEHVIVSGSSGGHSHESAGWHRSMPYEYTTTQQGITNEQHIPDELTMLPPHDNDHNGFPSYIEDVDTKPRTIQRKHFKHELSATDLQNYRQQQQQQQYSTVKTQN